MHKQYVDMLICPECRGKLEWDIKEENEERIINASIHCTECNYMYEVRDEIAVFLTNSLSRNDLWQKNESSLEKYFKEYPQVYEKLMNTPEEELGGADYWLKASCLEMKGDYERSCKMFQNAFKKIYTKDYIDGWMSQMDYILESVKKQNKPVVDIASGKGYLVEKLLKETNNYVVATDFSPNILSRNKEYYTFTGLYDKLSLIAFDARKTPFKDASIETMTSNLGLQNIERPGDVIKEMCRITKGKFMPIMLFINKNDKVHMDLMGNDAYATRENAVSTFNECDWNVQVKNSYLADIKPTPVGIIIEGGRIDGFPLNETKIEFCTIVAEK